MPLPRNTSRICHLCAVYGLLCAFHVTGNMYISSSNVVCFFYCYLFLSVTRSQLVFLNSTLSTRLIAYPGQEVVFTCETRNSLLLTWTSEDYIGSGGDRLETLFIDSPGIKKSNSRNPSTFATLIMASKDSSGVRVIVSELHIIASSQFPVSSVTCRGSSSALNKTITFKTVRKYQSVS